jgi:hypothetical protein
MRFRTRLALLAALAVTLTAALPASSAENLRLRFVNAGLPDSTVISMFVNSTGTTFWLRTDAIPLGSALAAYDTTTQGFPGPVPHVKNAAMVCAEVTGAIDGGCDTLYLFVDYSEDGGTTWFQGLPALSSGGLIGLPSAQSTRVFTWWLPADASSPLSFVWHTHMRFRLMGPKAGASIGLGTRLWLKWPTR